MRIALHHDDYLWKRGKYEFYSDRWKDLCKVHAIQCELVDIYSDPRAFERIIKCDAFMWRPPTSVYGRRAAMCLLETVELGVGLPVFPSRQTRLGFQDKLVQANLFRAIGCRTPLTHILFSRKLALEFIENAQFPLVAKFASGLGSRNVTLIEDKNTAIRLVEYLFGDGISSFQQLNHGVSHSILRRFRRAIYAVAGKNIDAPSIDKEIQQGYVYFQEYIPDNQFDVRVTVVGEKAVAFRRFNRPGDFRASGSGIIDWSPDKIPTSVVKSAFDFYERTKMQVVGLDYLIRDGQPLLIETAIKFKAAVVNMSPGWFSKSNGAAGNNGIEFHAGEIRIEDEIFNKFFAEIKN